MAPRELGAALRQEEELRRAEGMSPGARARVRLRLQDTLASGRRPAGSWRRARLAAVVAMAGVLALALWSVPSGRTAGGLRVEHASAELELHERATGVEVTRGHVTLVAPEEGLALKSAGPLLVRREAAGVRVVRGRAEFSVEHRSGESRPAVVLVSAGAIRVMGTRFTVEERGAGGTVTLHEGSIRFEASTGEQVLLRPGEALAWPLPSAPSASEPAEPEQAAKVPAPEAVAEAARPRARPSRVAPLQSVDEVLQEVEVLRSRHQFERAVQQLEEALRQQPRTKREVLSFELGSLLTHQLRDVQRACAHWARHQRLFRRGRYADQVARAREALSCDASEREARP